MTFSSIRKRRKTESVGNNISDSFMDSYEQESLACCAILDKVAVCTTNLVQITFTKKFLKNIVYSHLIHIRDMQSDIVGRKYVH